MTSPVTDTLVKPLVSKSRSYNSAYLLAPAVAAVFASTLACASVADATSTSAGKSTFYGGVMATATSLGGDGTVIQTDDNGATEDEYLSNPKHRIGYGGGVFLGYRHYFNKWYLSGEVSVDALGRPSTTRSLSNAAFFYAKLEGRSAYAFNAIAGLPISDSFSIQGLVGLTAVSFRWSTFNSQLDARTAFSKYNQVGASLGVGFENSFDNCALGAMLKYTQFGKRTTRLSGPGDLNSVQTIDATVRPNIWQLSIRLTVPFSS